MNLRNILTLVQYAPAIVKDVRVLFGDHKPDATSEERTELNRQKKAAALDETAKIVAILEGLRHEDVVNDAALVALVDEAVEIGVQQMKLADRMRQIQGLIASVRVVTPSAPGPDGHP